MTDTPLSSDTPPQEEDPSQVEDQWSAVVNCHDCNLNQIEVALQWNAQRALDPNPSDPTKQVRRWPVYLVAENYAQLDDQGRPTPGKPLELDLAAIRGVFSARYPNIVSGEDPPADGSHVHVRGMYFIGERDSAGNPTGRVILGDAEDAPTPTPTGA